MSTHYTTRDDAIFYEIVEPLGEFAEVHRVDAIAESVIFHDERGYYCGVSAVEFWDLVTMNEKEA